MHVEGYMPRKKRCVVKKILSFVLSILLVPFNQQVKCFVLFVIIALHQHVYMVDAHLSFYYVHLFPIT